MGEDGEWGDCRYKGVAVRTGLGRLGISNGSSSPGTVYHDYSLAEELPCGRRQCTEDDVRSASGSPRHYDLYLLCGKVSRLQRQCSSQNEPRKHDKKKSVFHAKPPSCQSLPKGPNSPEGPSPFNLPGCRPRPVPNRLWKALTSGMRRKRRVAARNAKEIGRVTNVSKLP